MIDSHGASPMLQRIQLERSKSTDRSKAEVHTILSYLKPSLVMPSGKLEGQLHKLDGIKRIPINHFSHTAKKHYYPSVVTAENTRSILKKLGSLGGD
jgi:hypothetical protein